MNYEINFKYLCVAGLVALLCAVPTVKAISPYVPDANTLHLWHLNELPPGTLPVITATETMNGGAYNLNVTNGASLMAPAYNVALDGSLDTQGSLDDIALNESGSYALDANFTGASGSFSYEALVYPAFDPTTSLPGRSTAMEIMTFDAESGNSTDRFFQFRLKPPVSNEQWSVEFSNIGSYTPAVGSNVWEVFEVVEDFSGDLSAWNSTVILDAGGMTTNLAYWQIVDGLQLDTISYDGIEQYAMIKSGVSLAAGEVIRAEIGHTGASQDIGLYVGGTPPVAGTRQDYVAVYLRGDGQLYSRGFDGTTEYGLSGGGAPADVAGVYVARNDVNTYETGWYDTNGVHHAIVTRTPTTPNDGDVVGVYADVRNVGTLGTVTNLVKVGLVGNEISPEQFIESFAAPLPVSGDHAAASSNWYHVAVSYNGSENTTDNLKMYWTRLDGANTAANLLDSFTMTNDIANVATNLNGEFSVGNEARGTSTENFVGLIDEVRISDVAIAANAFNVTGSPYTATASTLLLFHFNDTHDPVPEVTSGIAIDEVASNPIDLHAFDNPVFGTNAYTGFDKAVGFDKVSSPGTRLAAFENTPIAMSNFVDEATGAFTFEAVIQPQWFSAPGEHMNIMTAEGDGETIGRPFQFRIQDDGTTLRFDPIATRLNEGSLTTIMDVALPSFGSHALTAGAWYHVAIAYNGNEGVTNNVTVYWTKLDSGATEANVLTNFTSNGDLINPVHLGEFCVGNELRNFPGNGYDVEEFIGTIDEVRISKVARAASDFIFADGGVVIEPYGITAVVVSGGNATLTWESQSGANYTILRKTALTEATWSTAKSGISSAGDGTTSDSVAVSADEEFYQISAE